VNIWLADAIDELGVAISRLGDLTEDA
jgi:hypothetical protein